MADALIGTQTSPLDGWLQPPLVSIVSLSQASNFSEDFRVSQWTLKGRRVTHITNFI
ncbi:hypothetical protein HanIR_Chr11g0545341 [Helianthus annuus]|nr:hypothetical protein HanIR_Chr11g0545341 [Helianthus annuus]